MTSYGRAVVDNHLGRFMVEIHSVNRKHLDVHVLVPGELLRFDLDIRQWLKKAFWRGRVSVRVVARFSELSPVHVEPNVAYAKELKSAWEQIAEATGTIGKFDLSLLVRDVNLFSYIEDLDEAHETECSETLKEAVEKALEECTKAKTKEGKILAEDIIKRLSKIDDIVKSIVEHSSDAESKYHNKLTERLEDLFKGDLENEERILREVAIFADRVDISEEIVRFGVHMEHLLELLNSDKDRAIGKNLDFLLQEMNREVNTIGSKSLDSMISGQVVEIKSELEKIREQVQNIE